MIYLDHKLCDLCFTFCIHESDRSIWTSMSSSAWPHWIATTLTKYFFWLLCSQYISVVLSIFLASLFPCHFHDMMRLAVWPCFSKICFTWFFLFILVLLMVSFYPSQIYYHLLWIYLLFLGCAWSKFQIFLHLPWFREWPWTQHIAPCTSVWTDFW